MHDQLYRKGQTAQMAMYEAHKERLEWDHEGGPPPVHSHYGQVCFADYFWASPSPPQLPRPPLPSLLPIHSSVRDVSVLCVCCILCGHNTSLETTSDLRRTPLMLLG